MNEYYGTYNWKIFLDVGNNPHATFQSIAYHYGLYVYDIWWSHCTSKFKLEAGLVKVEIWSNQSLFVCSNSHIWAFKERMRGRERWHENYRFRKLKKIGWPVIVFRVKVLLLDIQWKQDCLKSNVRRSQAIEIGIPMISSSLLVNEFPLNVRLTFKCFLQNIWNKMNWYYTNFNENRYCN